MTNQPSHLLMAFGITLVLFLLVPGARNPTMTAAAQESASGIAPAPVPADEEVAVIETTMGRIVLRFFPDVAPAHVDSFKALSRRGFYDNTTFHRVIPGFMIQGGDPNSKDDNRANDGTGGPGYTLRAEFNDRPHKRGTLSMARAQDPNSAGSQFFICLGRHPHLDGQYTVFGEVAEGMDVVEAIGGVERDRRDNPITPVVMKKVSIIKYGDLKKQTAEEGESDNR